MKKFSSEFNINKTQAELDFVDINLEGDTPLYIDPYALTTREDEWSSECHSLVVSFFEAVLLAVKENNQAAGIHLLSHLNEPEETRLGVSRLGNKGRGIGQIQAAELFNALKNSKAANSGLLEDISDFALFIPQIGRDKISDITTNIIRGSLISYTQSQCELHGVSMRKVASGFCWDAYAGRWYQTYVDLPVFNENKILLVPKFTVRYRVGVDHSTFRSQFVLEFLMEEHKRADDALVTTIRNNKGEIVDKKVYKKTVDKHYSRDKDFLAEFSIAHPEVIDKYRDVLKNSSSKIPNVNEENFSEAEFAQHLVSELKLIEPGSAHADKYHELMIGIVSFLFFPNLIYPKKEAPINDGRKRIDITYHNGKESGFFYRIALDQHIKANIIPTECKNYTDDIANPEFDQLIGRFDERRGRLGILFYRSSDKPEAVIARCRDAAKSSLGVILPIDDNMILKMLDCVAGGGRDYLDKMISELFQKIVS
jgi:hypothetical protein